MKGKSVNEVWMRKGYILTTITFPFPMHFEFLRVLTNISRPFKCQRVILSLQKWQKTVKQLGNEPRGHSVKQLWFLSTEDIFQHSIFSWNTHESFHTFSKSGSGIIYVSRVLLNFGTQSKVTHVGLRSWLIHPVTYTDHLLGAGTLV